MPWFMTAYPALTGLPDKLHRAGSYGCGIWARDLPDAVRLARLRGLRETVVSGPLRGPIDDFAPVSEMIAAGAQWDHVLHAAIFTGWAALRAGAAGADEVLGDAGFLHEIMHARAPRRRLIARAREIERLIPGWLQPDRERRRRKGKRRRRA